MKSARHDATGVGDDTPANEWQSLEEIVGVVFDRLGEEVRDRTMRIGLPDHLPLDRFVPLLLEQALMNFFQNALRYTAGNSSRTVSIPAL